MNDRIVRLVVVGALGRMGSAVCALAARDCRFSLAARVDGAAGAAEGGCAPALAAVRAQADVVVDFSSPAALEGTLGWCLARHTACALCVTGYTEAQQARIREAAKRIPVFQSANCAPGVWLLAKLVRQAAAALPGYDVEILEAHHSAKQDAPSGTALLLADAVDAAGPARRRQYGRGPGCAPRKPGEVGLHAVRGGGIAGAHTVLLAGPHETLALAHTAHSRQLFAAGALDAAAFLARRPAGYYTMEELIP